MEANKLKRIARYFVINGFRFHIRHWEINCSRSDYDMSFINDDEKDLLMETDSEEDIL